MINHSVICINRFSTGLSYPFVTAVDEGVVKGAYPSLKKSCDFCPFNPPKRWEMNIISQAIKTQSTGCTTCKNMRACLSILYQHQLRRMIGTKRSHLHHLVPTTTAKVICSCRCYVMCTESACSKYVRKCFRNIIVVKCKVTFSGILIKYNKFCLHFLA